MRIVTLSWSLCKTRRLFRFGERVYDESSGQRISRDDEQGGQWTSVYELDKRGELHNNCVVAYRRHQQGKELLPACPVHQVEWTFVCDRRWSRNGSTGTMRRSLLRYKFLHLFMSYCIVCIQADKSVFSLFLIVKNIEKLRQTSIATLIIIYRRIRPRIIVKRCICCGNPSVRPLVSHTR